MAFLRKIYPDTSGLSRPVAISLALFFLAGMADGVLMPFFALWATAEAHIPTEYIGLLLGCYAGGELLATPLVGGIADRFGRRPVLLVSTTGVGLGFLLLYFTHGTPAAAASLILIGVFESVYHPTAATVIADVTPAEHLRGRYGLMRMAANAGHLVGPACGAILVTWSLGLVFLGSAVALLIGAGLVTLLLPETRPIVLKPEGEEDEEDDDDDDDDDDLSALATAFRDRRLAMLLIPVALLGVASSWIESLLSLYAVNAGTLTPSSVGMLFTYAAAIGVVFQIPVVNRTKHLAGSVIVTLGSLSLCLGFVALTISAQLPFLIVAVSCAAFSGMLSGPLTQTIATELSPVKARATYLAAFSAAGDLKDAAGPAIGTALYAIAGGLPWLVGMPLALGAGALLAAVARRHEAISGAKQQQG